MLVAVKAKECPGAAGTLSPCLELCQPPGGEGFMRCHHWGTPARGNTGSCQDASHDYVSLQLSQNKILGGLKKKKPFRVLRPDMVTQVASKSGVSHPRLGLPRMPPTAQQAPPPAPSWCPCWELPHPRGPGKCCSKDSVETTGPSGMGAVYGPRQGSHPPFSPSTGQSGRHGSA